MAKRARQQTGVRFEGGMQDTSPPTSPQHPTSVRARRRHESPSSHGNLESHNQSLALATQATSGSQAPTGDTQATSASQAFMGESQFIDCDVGLAHTANEQHITDHVESQVSVESHVIAQFPNSNASSKHVDTQASAIPPPHEPRSQFAVYSQTQDWDDSFITAPESPPSPISDPWGDLPRRPVDLVSRWPERNDPQRLLAEAITSLRAMVCDARRWCGIIARGGNQKNDDDSEEEMLRGPDTHLGIIRNLVSRADALARDSEYGLPPSLPRS